MEKLMAKVEGLLSTHFPGARNRIEMAETVPGEKVGGSFISEQFRGMPQIDRQTAVRQVLRENLTREEQICVGVIFTLTPKEVAAMDEVLAAA